MYSYPTIKSAFIIFILLLSGTPSLIAGQSVKAKPNLVKVTVVLVSGYDKTVTPGPICDAVRKAVSYIELAAGDTTTLVVLKTESKIFMNVIKMIFKIFRI